MTYKPVAPFIVLTNDGIIKSINVPYSTNNTSSASASSSSSSRKINPRDFLTEEILTANSTAKMAELVAKEIYSIRESKNALIRGQADFMPQDGQQLRLMLESLEDQEKALIEMFAGHYEVDSTPYIMRINPDKELNNRVAFRF